MKKRILRVLLPAFFAILLLTSASDAAEAPIRAVVFFEEDASPAAVEAALEDMEPGDLVQLSFDGQRFSHTPVVVAADHPKRLSDVLVAAHSYDRDYWPLSRYEFTDIRFLHIIGVNRLVF